MRIAVTGGIAEGKTTVLSYVREMGHEVVSADQVAREVFHLPEVNARLAVIAGLAEPVEPGPLRDAIASDPVRRRLVNQAMHPRILERLNASGASFFEVPLLVEACLYGRFDRVWQVTCGPLEQIRRLSDRYQDATHAAKLVATQLRAKAKTPFSDEVIRTNEDPQIVRQVVSECVVRAFGT